MKKFSPLKYLQIAWVTEVIVVLFLSWWAFIHFELERIELWVKFVPLIGGLIGAQAACAGIGPLGADLIKKKLPGGENE